MTGYVVESIHKYQHKAAQRPQDSPHKWERPSYGITQKITCEEDKSLLIPKEEENLIQPIVGTLPYYARYMDPTIMVALRSIYTNQSKIN